MEQENNILELEVDEQTSAGLTDAVRWGKLFGILCLVAYGLFFLVVILVWKQILALFLTMDELQGQEQVARQVLLGAFIAGFVVVGAILTVLMIFLIKGSNNISKGIRLKDQFTFNMGLANLKNYFVMYGILSVLMLVFSLLGMLSR